ncbi:MAG: cupin [Spirochaetes bacterium GWF1_49_6]|jgi:hypothetical protein|nr:MAG: cupin [Spirochaetes bacterium GWF1_49_6]
MVAIVEKPTQERLQSLGATKWPIWEKETSVFDWEYDESETCYILAGKVKVTSKSTGESVEFGKGDLVIFPQGLKCVWEISEDVRKHYRFG